MKEINLEEIIKQYCYVTQDGQKDVHSSITSVIEAIKDACKQVLELAAERATLLIYKENMDNASDNDKMYGKEYYHGQYDLNGSDYHMDIKIHKQSILDVINQVK